MYWLLFLKWNRVEILTYNLYLYELLVLKSSFSPFHSSNQDTEIFQVMISTHIVTCSDISALFHRIMFFQFDLCFEILH